MASSLGDDSSFDDDIWGTFGQPCELPKQFLFPQVNEAGQEEWRPPLQVVPLRPEIFKAQFMHFLKGSKVDMAYLRDVNPELLHAACCTLKCQADRWRENNPMMVTFSQLLKPILERFPELKAFFELLMGSGGADVDLRLEKWVEGELDACFNQTNLVQGGFYYFETGRELDFTRMPGTRPLPVFEMCMTNMSRILRTKMMDGEYDDLEKWGFHAQTNGKAKWQKLAKAQDVATYYIKLLGEKTQSLGPNSDHKLNPGELSQDFNKMLEDIGQHERSDYAPGPKYDNYWCVEPNAETEVLSMAIGCVKVDVEIKDFGRCCECHHELYVEIKHYSMVFHGGAAGGALMRDTALLMGITRDQMREWSRVGVNPAA